MKAETYCEIIIYVVNYLSLNFNVRSVFPITEVLENIFEYKQAIRKLANNKDGGKINDSLRASSWGVVFSPPPTSGTNRQSLCTCIIHFGSFVCRPLQKQQREMSKFKVVLRMDMSIFFSDFIPPPRINIVHSLSTLCKLNVLEELCNCSGNENFIKTPLLTWLSHAIQKAIGTFFKMALSSRMVLLLQNLKPDLD